jgi:hypothetical protein
MRYTKRALLLFGAGLVLGLVLVSANLSGLERIASLAMAAAILLLPIALVADWWRYRPWHTPPKPTHRAARAKAKPKSSPRRTAPTRRQTRKPR